MPLPNISNFILGTRQPLDFVGPAIDAWRTVSAEARATRAQNLAEVEAGRDAGQQAYDNQVDAVKLQDSLLNSATNREATMGHLEVRQLEHAAKMEQMKWERQNLLPMKLQQHQMDMTMKGLQIGAMGTQMQAERAMLGQFSSEFQDAQEAIASIAQGKPDGMTDTDYDKQVKNVNALLGNMTETWGQTGSPAIVQQMASLQAVYNKIPRTRYLKSQPNGLMTDDELARASQEKNNLFNSLMPFSSDEEARAYKAANAGRLESMMGLPSDQYTTVVKAEAERYQKEKNSMDSPATGVKLTDQQFRNIQRYNAAVSSGVPAITEYANDQPYSVPLESYRATLLGSGVPESMLTTRSQFDINGDGVISSEMGETQPVPGQQQSATFDPFAN